MEFIDSFGSVDELKHGRRSSKVSDPLRRHDLLDGMLVLGRPAKPTRSEKVEVELIFDFRDGKKPHQTTPRLRLVRQKPRRP